MKTKLILSLLVILYLILNLYSVFNESPVWDEPLQLKVGQLFWKTKEFILEPVEPPLARLYTSLPVAIFGKPLLTGFLGKIYFWPRLMVILSGCLFRIFFYKVLKELFDKKLALLGVVLFIFEPNLLTHSHYNTTDFIFSILFFASIYFLRKWEYWWGWLPVTLGLLFATKVSGPVIFLATVLLILISFKILKLKLPFKLKLFPNQIIIFLILFIITFWGCYLYKFNPAIGDNTAAIGKPYLYYIFENKSSWLKVFKTPIPLIDYLATLKYSVQYQKAGHLAIFNGQSSNFGWWWYFPMIFVLKTPIPLLILFFTSIFFILRVLRQAQDKLKSRSSDFKESSRLASARSNNNNRDIIFFLIPIISILILSLFVKINIGLRHILPIYPFLIVIAVFGFQKLWQKGKIWQIVSMGLLIWYIGRTVYYLPHPITFTNEFLPKNQAYKVLSDSNISWGQELVEINNYQLSTTNNQEKRINLFYFGNVKIEDYLSNVNIYGCDDPKGFLKLENQKHSPILVTATCLQKMAAMGYKEVLLIKPKQIIANSILAY